MICEKCGATLPEDATFCGECGTKVIRKKKTPAALEKAKSEAKRFKIASIILACFCLVLIIGWAITAITAHNPYQSLDNYEQEVVQVERAGIELTGTYVVGEDSELPEGRYNIYPPEGESYMDVRIYETKEDAKKQYDADYNSLALDNVYSLSRGYKLKAGQIVVIEYDSAFFELVSDDAAGTSETEAADPSEAETQDAADAENADAPPAENSDEE